MALAHGTSAVGGSVSARLLSWKNVTAVKECATAVPELVVPDAPKLTLTQAAPAAPPPSPIRPPPGLDLPQVPRDHLTTGPAASVRSAMQQTQPAAPEAEATREPARPRRVRQTFSFGKKGSDDFRGWKRAPAKASDAPKPKVAQPREDGFGLPVKSTFHELMSSLEGPRLAPGPTPIDRWDAKVDDATPASQLSTRAQDGDFFGPGADLEDLRDGLPEALAWNRLVSGVV